MSRVRLHKVVKESCKHGARLLFPVAGRIRMVGASVTAVARLKKDYSKLLKVVFHVNIIAEQCSTSWFK